MDNLELVKENVLPLKNGRKIDSLKAALSVSSVDSTKREDTRLQFEKDIESLMEDKLLETYYNYINFIEQNYPDGGKEANLNGILEKCIQTFYNKDEFKNNSKLLSIFIKYTNNVNNPIAVFDFFFKIGFAKKLAQFYISWSYYLETQSNYKKALKVINAGIKNEAEPVSELKNALNDLQIRTMRFVNSNEDDKDSTTSQRKALNNLKTKRHEGKVDAPIKRYGNSIKDNTGLKNVTEKNVANSTNEPLQIYNDDNEVLAVSTVQSAILLDGNEENNKKLEKWANNKLNLKKVPVKPVDNFVIHVDLNDKESKVTPKVNDVPKAEINWPVVKLESKEMLAKYIWYNQIDEIYKDGLEYSFEELRYEKWLKNRSNVNEECKTDHEQSSCMNSSSKSSINDQSCKEATCSIVRGFFNGTIATTTVVDDFNQTHTAKCKTANEIFEIFETSTYPNEKQESSKIIEKESKADIPSEFTISVLKSDDFNACSSSTPFISRAFKRPSSATMKYCNNSNFVSGITAKLLSPIIETSREFNSKSSSSSGTNSSTSTAVNYSQKKTLIYSDNIDPFDLNFKSLLLRTLSEPIEFRKGFSNIQKPLPLIKIGMNLNIFQDCYLVVTQIFESKLSSFFKVIKDKSDLNQEHVDIDHKNYSLKLHRKLNYWEFYICDELHRRLAAHQKDNPDIELSVLSINEIVFYNDGYLLINDLAPNGTLKNFIIKMQKIQTKFPSTLMSLFILELIIIIKQIHKCRIIHGDINPDNILVFNTDDIDLLPKRTSALKLINFDKAIDMDLLPEETIFNKNYNKNEKIYEILDDKNWTFQIDWIGFLNCIHWMAFGTDMHVVQECGNSKWKIEKTFNVKNKFLNELFDLLLNMDCEQEPDLDVYVRQLSADVISNEKNLKVSFSELHIGCFDCNLDKKL